MVVLVRSVKFEFEITANEDDAVDEGTAGKV